MPWPEFGKEDFLPSFTSIIDMMIMTNKKTLVKYRP
jgi:hypothetical protein